MRGGVLKKAYDTAALLALLNLLGLAGLVGALVATGQLNRERGVQLVEVLRGGGAVPPVPETLPATAEPTEASPTEPAPMTALPPAESGEILRREAERLRTELDQRLALSNRVLLRVSMERETLQREQAEAARKQQEATAEADTSGFRKQVEIFEGLSPKVAIDYLLNVGDADDAARLLVAMDPRKSRKIVEAAKDEPQKAAMQQILQRVREVAPTAAEQLEE
jgi:hypothetical protein